jgi:3'-phosphoadenosine 5'-phosphosulfate sulfotransferase (PAPS reductase)/FAD synthetase
MSRQPMDATNPRREFPVQLPKFLAGTRVHVPPVALVPEVQALLASNSPVAVGVSGGKDSQACAHRVYEHLDEIGHTGPRILIHSDLGSIEWEQSLPACESLARNLNTELVVVRRAAGGMIERWELRWTNNVTRYINLSCVQLILPWSTPALKFCTSEQKTQVIAAALSRRFSGQEILSVTGIRREESPSRKKAEVFAPYPRITGRRTRGWTWNAIIDWKLSELLPYIASRGEKLHPAYSEHGCSRVSCSFCIMSSGADLKAASGFSGNAASYRRLVGMELRSTFAFQGARWLADVAPHLLAPEMTAALPEAKRRAAARVAAESKIPRHLLYTAGWPTCIPTQSEAELLAGARRDVAQIVGIEIRYNNSSAIRERYAELIALKDAREASKARHPNISLGAPHP